MEEEEERRRRETRTGPVVQDLVQDRLQPIQPDGETDEVGHDHHDDVGHGTGAAEHAVLLGRVLFGREQEAGDDLGHHEEHDEPAPDEQAQTNVVPQRDKGEDEEKGRDGADGAAPAAGKVGAAEGHVDVADEPAVVGAVPCLPERLCGEVVGDAADHVLGRVDAVEQGPETEEAPGEEQFEPDEVKVEEGKEGQLSSRVVGPDRGGVGDGANIVVVEDDFHGQKGEHKADRIPGRPGPFDTGRTVLEL